MELVDNKVIEALKMTQDKVEKTHSSVLDAKAQKVCGIVQPLKLQNGGLKIDHKVSESFRVQGVAEDPEKVKAENLLTTTQKVNEVLNPFAERPNIVDSKSLGKLDQKKSKTVELVYNVIKWVRSAFRIDEGQTKTTILF